MLLNKPNLNVSGNEIISAAAEIEKLEQERQKRSDVASDKLVKSITDLTKTLVDVEKDAARTKSGGAKQGTLGGLLGGKLETAKSLTTGSGIFGALANNTKNPIMSAVFGQLAERQAKKEEAQRKTKDFVSTVASGTTYGRSLAAQVGNEKAAELLKADYNKRAKLETKIYAKEEKRKAIVAMGQKAGVAADLAPEELEELEKYKTELKESRDKYLKVVEKEISKDLEQKESALLKIKNPESNATLDSLKTKQSADGEAKVEPQDANDKKTSLSDADFSELKQELLESIKEVMLTEIKTLPSDELKALTSKGPEFMSGIGMGIFEEIQSLSKEQLEQLIKIQKSLDVSKESILESKTASISSALLNQDREEKDKKQPQLMEKLLGGKITDKLGGLLDAKKIGSVLKGGVSGAAKLGGAALRGLAPLLGPAAAVAGAGAAGWAAGGMINDAVEKNTGDSVGGHTYTGVQKFKSFIGMETDQDKIEKAEKDAVLKHIEEKKKSGSPISPYIAQEAKKYKIDVTGLEVLQKKTDIKTNASNQTDKNVTNQTNNLSSVTDKNVTNQTNNLSNLIETTSNSSNKIQKGTFNLNSAQMLEQATDQSMPKTQQSNSQTQPVIVNAPQTVNNQTTQIVRPPLRNSDPSWLDTTGKRLTY